MAKKFLINTITDWNEPPRARHQVTTALAKRYEVIYVSANKVGRPKLSISNESDNLQVIQPYFPIDFRMRYRIPLLNEIYQIWLYRKLKKSFSGYTIINFDFAADIIHLFFKDLIFYCNDNFPLISKRINVWPIYKYHQFCFNKIAGNARVCIGTSFVIASLLKKININSFEIPLGGPNIEEYDIKPNPNRGGKERIINVGLLGFISNYNMSYELINDILSQVNCKLTLIGSVDPSFYDKIENKDRVDVKGILTGKDLLDEVNKFDVATVPYLDQKKEEGGIPNKLFIYLALGKPAVVSESISLRHLNLPEKWIYLTNDNKIFPDLIEKAYVENNENLILERVNYAKENTWDKRMEYLIDILDTIV